LLFGSIRLNIGAFFSISGIIINLHRFQVQEKIALLHCMAIMSQQFAIVGSRWVQHAPDPAATDEHVIQV